MKEEKPTREERLKAYEYAREWLNKNMYNQVGVCRLLQMATDPNDYFVFFVSDFPEFLEMKPKDKEEGSYWFNSAKERIQVLTKIINKMKDEKRINVELPSDCEAKFDEENNVLIISKKEEGVYIPDSVKEIEGREWYINASGGLDKNIYGTIPKYINNVSTKERAKAFLALMQLVEMRDASNRDWRADWRDENQDKWVIYFDEEDDVDIFNRNLCRDVLVFKTLEIADAFVKKHRELILTAKELL